LGHFPYAHSLKELPLEDHEALTAKIVAAEPLRTLVARAGADPYLTAAIVDVGLPVNSDAEAVFFRKLLSGVLDPDKLDYLNRDARFCGVPYGAQDVDFTFSRLHPHPVRGVDVDSRGVQSVEAILFAKYLMYRSVYWHRTVRVATAMVKKAVSAGLESGVLSPEELYGLDDDGLFALLGKKSHPAFALAADAREARFLSIAAEFPFAAEKARHLSLTTPEGRAEAERTIAEGVSRSTGARIDPVSLVVDLPEPISFETGLFVADEGVPFEQSSTVFRPPVVDSFTRSLRVVRVCAPENIAPAVGAYCASYKNE
jgi:HD superfamily phosphohydrolase